MPNAELKLVLMPGKCSRPDVQAYRSAIYHTWRLVWTDTLKELDGAPKLHSDDFTKQDTIAGLMLGDLCVGLVAFRKINVESSITWDDSWFDCWPKDLLSAQGRSYPNGLIISWFTVHPDFRRTVKGQADFQVAKRLTEIVSFFCREDDCDVAFGTTRNNRSVNELAFYGGAKTLAQSKAHGVDVDLIAYYPEQLAHAVEGFPFEAHDLWKHKIDFSEKALRKLRHYLNVA